MQNVLTLDQSIAIKPLSIKLNLKRFSLVCFAFIILLLAVYTFQANDLVRQTYSIKQYETQSVKVSQENSNLKINFSKSNSLDSVETLAANFNFEKINDAKYIQLMNNQVAVNR
jgi:predicted signal transduction protein with EAL and GGDEF domain